MLETGISSIDQYSIEMGQTAAKLFPETISNTGKVVAPQRIILSPESRVRESSKRNNQ